MKQLLIFENFETLAAENFIFMKMGGKYVIIYMKHLILVMTRQEEYFYGLYPFRTFT